MFCTSFVCVEKIVFMTMQNKIDGIQDWAKRDFKKCEIFQGWLINWAYGM